MQFVRPVFIGPPQFDATTAGTASAAACAAAALMDGDATFEHVAGALLVAGHTPAAIFGAVDWLAGRGWLTEHPSVLERQLPAELRKRFEPQLQFWADVVEGRPGLKPGFETSGEPEQTQLLKSTVLVVGDGPVAVDYLRKLEWVGVGRLLWIGDGDEPPSGVTRITDVANIPSEGGDEAPSLLVHAPDLYEEETALELNRLAIAQRLPFLCFRRSGLVADLGPLVIPGGTACHACYTTRYRVSIMPDEFELGDPAGGNLLVPIGVDWLVVESLRVLLDFAEPVTRGRVVRLNYWTGQTELHPVLKLPRCPACGVHMHRPQKRLWEE